MTAQRFDVDFFAENDEWDDEGECIHFHFNDECPACHSRRAGANYFGSPNDCLEDGGVFKCQECDSTFKIIEYDVCREPFEAVIELVKLNTDDPAIKALRTYWPNTTHPRQHPGESERHSLENSEPP